MSLEHLLPKTVSFDCTLFFYFVIINVMIPWMSLDWINYCFGSRYQLSFCYSEPYNWVSRFILLVCGVFRWFRYEPRGISLVDSVIMEAILLAIWLYCFWNWELKLQNRSILEMSAPDSRKILTRSQVISSEVQKNDGSFQKQNLKSGVQCFCDGRNLIVRSSEHNLKFGLEVNCHKITIFSTKKSSTNRILSNFYHRISRLGGNRI